MLSGQLRPLGDKAGTSGCAFARDRLGCRRRYDRLSGMRSIADELRLRDRDRVAGLSVPDRIRLAFTLGDLAVECFSAYNGVPKEVARRRLRALSQRGRRPSRCLTTEAP